MLPTDSPTANGLHRVQERGHAASAGPKPPRTPLLVESREAARLLKVSERTLWGLTAAGEIRAVLIGRAKRYAVSELEAFVRRRMDEGAP